VIDILIPPLRDRREDLAALCHALLTRIADEAQISVPDMATGTLEQLSQLPLLGNVRELENLLHRALALCDGEALRLDDIHTAPSSAPTPLDTHPVAHHNATDEIALPTDLQRHLDQQEREILVKTLQETGFNRTSAASRLGLTLRQIRYRIARLKIDVPKDDAADE
jgi:two-component system response regulator PilR (NtrC family)